MIFTNNDHKNWKHIFVSLFGAGPNFISAYATTVKPIESNKQLK